MLRPLAFALAAAFAASSAAAAAAPAATPTKALRTLVYSVRYSATSRNDEQTSGFTGAGGAVSVGSATTTRTATTADDGTLTVAVIAATADGGLVVDASFAGKKDAQPVIRVAILPDGRLSAPPGAELSPASRRVLPMLARGVVAGRRIETGATWAIEAAEPARGRETFRVTAVDGDIATLDIDVSDVVPGPRGFDEHGKLVAVYDTARLRPTKFTYTGTARHQAGLEQYVTMSLHLDATLVSDTFG